MARWRIFRGTQRREDKPSLTGRIALTAGIIGCLTVMLMAARSQTGRAYVRVESPLQTQANRDSWLLRVEPHRGGERRILELGPLRFRRVDADEYPGPYYLGEFSRKSTLFRPVWPKLDQGPDIPLAPLASPLRIERPARLIAIVGHPNQTLPPAPATPKPAATAPAPKPVPAPAASPAPSAPPSVLSKLLGDSEPAEPVERVSGLGTGDRLILPRFGDAARMDVGWLLAIKEPVKMVSPEIAWTKIDSIAFLVTIGPPGASPPSGPEWFQLNLGIADREDKSGDEELKAFGLVAPLIASGENCDDIKISVKIGRNGAVRTLGPTRPIDLGVKIGTLLSELSWRRISEEQGTRGQVGLEPGDLIYLRAPDLGTELQKADFVEVTPVLKNTLPLRFQAIRPD